MKDDNKIIPAWVTEMLASGNDTFYKQLDGFNCYWDTNKKDHLPIPKSEKEICEVTVLLLLT